MLLFRQYTDLLSLQGMKLENGETSALFAKRVDKLLGLSNHYGLSTTAEIFQLARYSSHDVTEEQKQLMLAFRKDLLTSSRHKLGLLRYLYFKWLWKC